MLKSFLQDLILFYNAAIFPSQVIIYQLRHLFVLTNFLNHYYYTSFKNKVKPQMRLLAAPRPFFMQMKTLLF